MQGPGRMPDLTALTNRDWESICKNQPPTPQWSKHQSRRGPARDGGGGGRCIYPPAQSCPVTQKPWERKVTWEGHSPARCP